MVSSWFVPWYNRPARPFPAKVWLEARYFFRLPPLGITQRPLGLGSGGAFRRRCGQSSRLAVNATGRCSAAQSASWREGGAACSQAKAAQGRLGGFYNFFAD